MASKHTIEVTVLAETRKAAAELNNFAKKAGLDKLSSGLKSMASGAGKALKAIAVATAATLAGAGAAGGLYLKNAIADAGDLQQSIGAVDTVFKDNAAQMHQWAQGAAQAVGLTRDQYNQLSTVIGTQLKNGGTAISEISGKTNELVTLGADLASMFGGTTADAVGALSSALKGERDPIERYGVSLKQATIDARAAELGFKKVGGSLSDEAQQAATLSLIMEQTSDAHGNFAKEADTLQGKQQRLAAEWGNLSAQIGTAFLPAMTGLVGFIGSNVLPALTQWGTTIASHAAPALQQLGGWITGTVLPALSQFGGWITGTVIPALTTWGTTIATNLAPMLTAIGAWLTTAALPALQQFGSWIMGAVIPALAQWAVTFTANLWPTLQQLGAWLASAQGWLLPIAAGVAAVVAAYKAWTITTAAWKVVTTAAAAAQGILNAVMAANPVARVILVIVGLVAAITTLWHTNEGFRNAVAAAWNFLKGAAASFGGAVKSVFSSVGSAISSFVNGARSAFSSVGSAVGQLASSIGSNINRAVSFFTSLPGKITGALSGIGGQLAGIGRNMIQSLANALSPGAIVAKIRSVIGDVIGFAKRLLGIASPSKVFMQIGAWTGEGLVIGLDSSVKSVRAGAVRLARAVTDAGTPDRLDLDWTPTPRPVLAGAGTVFAPTINIHSLQPSRELARTLSDILEDWWRRRGQR